MDHTVRDDYDSTPTLGNASGMQSALGSRAVTSGYMSGTLGDVFMSTRGSFSASLEVKGMCDENDALSSKQCNSTQNSMEWQILKNARSNASKFSDSDCRVPILNQKHYMAPAGTWECGRMEGRVVNYLQSFGPMLSDSSGCNLDGQLRELRPALDGQLLSNVVRRKGCDAAEANEEEFGADSKSTQTRILGGNISAQQLVARGLGIPSSASTQQLSRSPNHGIRNLFPEQSSSFSSMLTHQDLCNDVHEQPHLPKKARTQEYLDGPSPAVEVDAKQLSNGARYRSSFSNEQFASLMDSTSYELSTTFLPSLPDRSTFNTNIPSLQSPSLPSFKSSGQPLPMKTSNESVSLKSPLVSYGYSNDIPAVRGVCSRCPTQGGLAGAQLGAPVADGSSFRPSNLLDVLSPQSDQDVLGRNYMQAGPYMQDISRRQLAVDTGGRGAWPAGFISFPSLSLDSSIGVPTPVVSPRPSVYDMEQPKLEHREARRGHSVSDFKTRLVIQKQLTTTDVGPLGRIILPKKEAESHLPHLPDKDGIELCLYDYDVERAWVMKYRFWPNNKSRMYLLENTGEFSKFHGLQQGDMLLIYREQTSRYVLRAKKLAPPLIPITPSQSVIEPGEAAASDLCSADTASRTMTTAAGSAGKEVNGSSVNGSHPPSDVLRPAPFSWSSGGAKSSILHDFLDAKSSLQLGTARKDGSHQLAAEGAQAHQQQHRPKPCVAVVQQQVNHVIAGHLDEQGVYLEEFPSLMGGEEIDDHDFHLESSDSFHLDSSDSDLCEVENDDHHIIRRRAAALLET